MKKLILLVVAMLLPVSGLAKPDKEEFECEVVLGTIEAEMEFSLKEKRRKIERKFEAEFEIRVGEGANAGDIIAVTIDGVAVGEMVLELDDYYRDDNDKLKAKLKFKKEADFPENFPVIQEGSIGTFNGLSCIFQKD